MLDPAEIHYILHILQDVKFTKKLKGLDLFIPYNFFGSRRKKNSKLADKIDSVAGNIKRPVPTTANF